MSRSNKNSKRRSVTLPMVSRLGGFIAKNDNSVSLDSGSNDAPGVSISEEEAAAFLKTIDCSVPGSRTSEHAYQLLSGAGSGCSATP